MEVYINSNLKNIPQNRINHLVDTMLPYAGLRTYITAGPYAGNFYRLDIDKGLYNWHHSLLLPVNINWLNRGDTVEIIQFSADELPSVVSYMEAYAGEAHKVVRTHGYDVELDGNVSDFIWHYCVLKKVNLSNKFHNNKFKYPKYFTPKM